MDKYIEVINEIEKLDAVIKTPRYETTSPRTSEAFYATESRRTSLTFYRMCCHSLLEFLKAVCYYIKNVKKST